MNKFVVNAIKAGALGAALLACVPFANARDHVNWSVSVGSGGYSPPVVYSPPPVYYYSPPPVVYAPPVVTQSYYYQPAPVVTYPQGYVYYSNSYPTYYYRDYGRHHHHHHD